jgi:uncharacterized protein
MDIKNPLLRNISIAVGILLALFLLALSIREFKELRYVGKQFPPTNVISVQGQGETVAIPDIAVFTFGVTAEGKDVETAQKEVTKKMNAALDFLKKNSIAEKDVKTTGYTIYPVYDYTQGVCTSTYCSPGRQILRGYSVNQTVEVKVRKTDDAGKLLSGIGALGVNNVSGLQFSVDNIEKVRAEAREKAIVQAHEEAQRLARALGVRLVRITSFYENREPYYYAERSMAADGKGGIGMAVQSVAPQIPGGEQKIASNVTITYEIR